MKIKSISKKLICLILGIIVIFNVASCSNQDNTDYSFVEQHAHTQFNVVDSLPDGNNQRLRVILLAGQSNASGACSVQYLKNNVSEQEFSVYEQGISNVYINYFVDNGYNSSKGEYVVVKAGQGFTNEYFGPELEMARLLGQDNCYQKTVILKYSWGGTNLHQEWLSPSSNGRTGVLYTAFMNFMKANLDYLKSKNYQIDLQAICWMQGESDAFSPVASKYKQNTINFIADIRKDLKGYGDTEKMLFIDAGIAEIDIWKEHKTINQAKKEVAEENANNIYIDTNYYGLTTNLEPIGNPDIAHYDSLSGIKLGELFAKAVLHQQV